MSITYGVRVHCKVSIQPSCTHSACVDNCMNLRAAAYEVVTGQVKSATYKTTTISELTDGKKVLIMPVEGEIPAFEVVQTYMVRNFTISVKHTAGGVCSFGPQ